jgi:hypothetical protein
MNEALVAIATGLITWILLGMIFTGAGAAW